MSSVSLVGDEKGRSGLVGVCNVKFGNPLPAVVSLLPNYSPALSASSHVKESLLGLILGGIKCQHCKHRHYIYVFYFYNRPIDLVIIVFANIPGDWHSIPGRVIPKTQKWYLIPPYLTLSFIRYISMVKWGYPEKGLVPSLNLFWTFEKGSFGMTTAANIFNI